jgi:hypothetical protein
VTAPIHFMSLMGQLPPPIHVRCGGSFLRRQPWRAAAGNGARDRLEPARGRVGQCLAGRDAVGAAAIVDLTPSVHGIDRRAERARFGRTVKTVHAGRRGMGMSTPFNFVRRPSRNEETGGHKCE